MSTPRRAALWGGVALVLVLLAVTGGRGRTDGPPLDPSSTGPLGTKALVLLLRDLGGDVSVADAPPTSGVALLFYDDLDPPDRDGLASWVESGGTLVVTDPNSPLVRSEVSAQGRAAPDGGIPTEVLGRRCDVPALAGAARVRPGGGTRFRPAPDAAGCYLGGGGAFVVVEPRGAGAVIALGSPLVWVNDLLGDEDNSILAASLLAPVPGTDVVLLRPPAPGGGQRSLVDLVPDRVRTALWQLVAAFGVVVLWRARRLGRPVIEEQPVQLPGSELVVAVGDLLQQGRRRDVAAAMVRSESRRVVGSRLGLPPDAPAAAIAAAVAARADRREDTVLAAFEDRPVSSDRELVELARLLDSIREDVAHAR